MLPMNSARAAEPQLFQLARQRGHRAAHAAEITHHAIARRRQRQAAAYPLEQRLADGLLQLVQHLAGGRLGHVQRRRRRAQRAAFLDGQQQHDLPHAQARQQGGGIQGSFHD